MSYIHQATGDQIELGLDVEANVVENVGVANVRIETLNKLVQNIKVSRIILYIIAAATTAFGIYSIAQGDSATGGLAFGIGVLAEAAIWMALGWFVPQRPLLCTTGALLLYLLNQVLQAYESGIVVFEGYLWKGFILVYIGRGVYAAYRLGAAREDLRAIGVSRDHLRPAERLEAVESLAIS